MNRVKIIIIYVLFALLIVGNVILSYRTGYKRGYDSAKWDFSQCVYISENGKKYHLPNCTHIEKSSIKPVQINNESKNILPAPDVTRTGF